MKPKLCIRDHKTSISHCTVNICKEFGLNKLKNRDESGLTRDEIVKIEEFHKAIKEKYNEITGEE